MPDPGHGRAVAEALDTALGFLGAHTGRDWTVPAGTLEWSCRDTAVHVAHDLLAYAGQLAARSQEAYLPLDLTVRPGAGVPEVLRVVRACGTLLVQTLDRARPQDRAWHWGPCDPAGFAALGVDEILVHTYDISQGLGLDWQPPAAASAAVLRRLFPDVRADAPAGDPGRILLWSTGRIALDGRPRRTGWTLGAALPR